MQERGQIRSRATRLCNKHEDDLQSLIGQERNMLCVKLREIKDELKMANRAIHLHKDFNHVKLDEFLDSEEEYDDRIGMILLNLEVPDSANASSGSLISSVSNGENANRFHTKVKLPEIKLPTFGNHREDNFRNFIRSFESVIDKHKLSDYERFVYMKNQLTGGPLALVNSIDVSQQQYTVAKKLLEDAFDNAFNAKNDVIKRLSNLKQKHGDPYEFIGELKSITTNFKSLEIETEDVLQFFIWQSLDNRFQTHLTQITNKSKPSLEEIENNLFEACSRYIKEIETNPKTKSLYQESFANHSTAMAVNFTPKSSKDVFCGLCQSDKRPCDHAIRHCSVYATPKQKFEKLKALGGCIKCSFVNHKSSECKFKFSSPCKTCQNNHMTFLCLKTSNSPENEFSKGEGQNSFHCNNASAITSMPTVNSSPPDVKVAFSSAGSSIILPTFTAAIKGSSGDCQVRVFKDGGCQSNFIDKELVDQLQLPILNSDIAITIDGFNNAKTIKTKLVRVPLVIGGVESSIEAISIDKIRTKFEVNRINTVVNHFIYKGYKIADNWLINDFTGRVSNIGIVLGSGDDHLIPMCTEIFGKTDSKSTYLSTNIGVVFSGNIDRMISNLPYLPSKINTSTNNVISEKVTFLLPNKREESSDFGKNDCSFGEFTYDKSSICDELSNLDILLSKTLCLDEDIREEGDESETNMEIVDYILQNTSRDNDGRLIMPLSWNTKNCHMLSRNYNLCNQILNSTYKKLQKDDDKLTMYDNVFQEQLRMGIIEKIPNVDAYIKQHPDCAFMAHMGVFRMGHESTKCRVVFLSNLCEKKNGRGFSHNQVMLPGPCLNQKMSTAVTLIRFDKYLLTFDLKKAFLMIKLRENDSNRLLFLWYNDISKGDYTIVGFKTLRLPFGIRPSPTTLMVGLYKMLIMDKSDNDYLDNLKKMIYNGIYMDNGSYTTNDVEDLKKAYNALPNIFSPYRFELQQFYTNQPELQAVVDDALDSPSVDEIKLFGLIWNRANDTISPAKILLDEKANSKRKVLAALNGIYDLFNVYAPVLLRAKLFMQMLQTNQDLSWDDELTNQLQRDWINIVRQVNMTPKIEINRSVGRRDGNFSLVCFTDASADAYGCVVYIKDNETNVVSFLMAKNRLLPATMQKKTMPSLELQALEFGLQVMIDVCDSLSGSSVVCPIKITQLCIFTDNMTCIHWLELNSVKFDKVQKLSVFVRNRLANIDRLCQGKLVSFRHVAGEINPADTVTRPFSYRVLQKTCFYSGPDFLKDNLEMVSLDTHVNIPNPILRCEEPDLGTQASAVLLATARQPPIHLVPLDRYSGFVFTVNVYRHVLRFIHFIKEKVRIRKGISNEVENVNFYKLAYNTIIRTEQERVYPDEYEYLRSKKKTNIDLPELVSRLNLYLDNNEILRVRGKLPAGYHTPALLPKNSLLTNSIIRDIHESLNHCGLYPVLKELRKNFWIESYFSTVKKVLKNCIVCRRINEPPINLNQNCYRDFRINPENKPFSYVFLDYAGPFFVTLSGEKVKVWLLLITCLYTRALNIKLCRNATVDEFMRALQLHIFENGIFQLCMSDLGSQIQAGAHLIENFLSDEETKSYLECNGMKVAKFQQFCKGNSSLGSLIEICVKMTKHLLQKSIRSLVLDYFEFEFMVCKIIDLVNKRPIAFKESLRSLPQDEIPFCITPEILVKGYETCSLSIIPELQYQNLDDPDFCPDASSEQIIHKYEKLLKVKSNLIEAYNSEFLATLMHQAVDKKDRYKPVLHRSIKPGDIVLLVDKHVKRYNFPMARVQKVEINSLGEVTAAYLYKGSTKEVVYRHVTSLILLISVDGFTENAGLSSDDPLLNKPLRADPPSSLSSDPRLDSGVPSNYTRKRPHRAAADRCRERLKMHAI